MGSRFTGKVALVMGAGQEIGRAVALLLAEEGASVVLNDVGLGSSMANAATVTVDQVAKEISLMGGTVVTSHADVSSMSGGESVVQLALDVFGRLDVLVNNVGISDSCGIQEMTPEEFDNIVRNNLRSTFISSRFASIHFRKQRSGRIVNMTSDAGLGVAGRSSYAATSEGIVGLTRTVAKDLGKYGVICNAISPMSMGDSGTRTEPEDIATMIVLLCGDTVPNVNGRVFGLSGGEIWLYEDPYVNRSVHKWGAFKMDELECLLPSSLI